MPSGNGVHSEVKAKSEVARKGNRSELYAPGTLHNSKPDSVPNYVL